MLEWITDIINTLLAPVLSLLPHSPFTDIINRIGSMPYLAWLNWFIPIRAALTIMKIWLGAVSLFYIYSIIMRWIKMIGD